MGHKENSAQRKFIPVNAFFIEKNERSQQPNFIPQRTRKRTVI